MSRALILAQAAYGARTRGLTAFQLDGYDLTVRLLPSGRYEVADDSMLLDTPAHVITDAQALLDRNGTPAAAAPSVEGHTA